MNVRKMKFSSYIYIILELFPYILVQFRIEMYKYLNCFIIQRPCLIYN